MTPSSVELAGWCAPEMEKALCSVSVLCGQVDCTSTPVCGSPEDQGARDSGGGSLGGIS